MQTAEIICDSKNTFGQRITTFKLTFWRALLAEANTHRMLTRNSASSRAIRFQKMVESVQNNPFIPIRWQKDHTGMQGTEYFTEDEVIDLNLVEDHLIARDYAIEAASRQSKKGVTKQLCNRYLEPFMYHTCLLTATELQNFFALRAHGAAEIHFQDLANKMLEAINQSEPKQLNPGDYHIPFGDQMIEKAILEWASKLGLSETEIRLRIATVRCARISYANAENPGSWDYEADLKLFERLTASGHWSSHEHCARAMSETEYYSHFSGKLRTQNETTPDYEKLAKKYGDDKYAYASTDNECQKEGRLIHEHLLEFTDPQFGWCKNFRGFIQYRAMFNNENRSDPRLLKK